MGSVVRVWTSQAPRLVRGRMTMGGSQFPHLSTREFSVGPSSAAVLSSLLQGWGALGLGGRGCCSHWGPSLLQASPYGAAATACEGDRGALVFVCPQLGGALPPRAALTAQTRFLALRSSLRPVASTRFLTRVTAAHTPSRRGTCPHLPGTHGRRAV